jgi:hypothetical protein
MTKRVIGGALAILLLGVAGCGGSRDSLTRENINLMNEMSDVLEKSADFAEAKPKLDALIDRAKDVKKRLDAMGKPSDKEEQELKKKYEPDLQKAAVRFFGASMQLAKKDAPGFEQLQTLMKNLKE